MHKPKQNDRFPPVIIDSIRWLSLPAATERKQFVFFCFVCVCVVNWRHDEVIWRYSCVCALKYYCGFFVAGKCVYCEILVFVLTQMVFDKMSFCCCSTWKAKECVGLVKQNNSETIGNSWQGRIAIYIYANTNARNQSIFHCEKWMNFWIYFLFHWIISKMQI